MPKANRRESSDWHGTSANLIGILLLYTDSILLVEPESSTAVEGMLSAMPNDMQSMLSSPISSLISSGSARGYKDLACMHCHMMAQSSQLAKSTTRAT